MSATTLIRAAELLEMDAADLKSCSTIDDDWGDELEARDAHDEMMRVAGELRGMLAAAPEAPSTSAGWSPDDDLPDAVVDAVAEAIGGAYDCMRVWGAWSVGTMGPDDFLPVADDAERVAEIARAALEAAHKLGLMAAAPEAPEQAAQPVAPEMVDILGVRADGSSAIIGQAPMPATMKARELVLDRFGRIDEDAGDDGAMALWCCLDLLQWLDGQAVQPADVARLVEAQTDAARDVLAERRRQIEVEGWTPEHDDEHDAGELSSAASAYALAAADELHPLSQGDGDYRSRWPDMWPWGHETWKPSDPRRMLVKAGALIIAEIERMDRTALAAKGGA